MSRVFAGLTLTAFLSAGIASAALPRAYFGLASVGAAAGYHGWKDTVQGRRTAWWDVNGAVVEGRWILNSGLGFGLHVVDVTGVLRPDDYSGMQLLLNTFTELAPSVLWVAHHNDHGFGYLELQVMPWADSAYGASLDYGYVPFAPWPIELRARAAATGFSRKPDGQIG
jgi:hypothetical protein